MKITIDTKEDSPEEIRKLISLLSSLAGGHSNVKNIFEEPASEPVAAPGLFNIFDDTPKVEPKEEDKEESPKVELMMY